MREQGELKVSKASREEVEKLLNRGLRQRWYPIAPSWMVQENPLGVTRLSENLAIWRDESGIPHVIEDRCPHRGARLSLGWNLGDRLSCWYHLAENAESESVRLGATRDLLDRAGFRPVDRHEIVKEKSVEELNAQLVSLVGEDGAEMLISAFKSRRSISGPELTK